MRVLVTGGAGYIGSHTAKLLARSGLEPVVFDNLSEGHIWAVKWGPFVEGDLADSGQLRSVLQEYGIEAVIHFAASAYVGESTTNPRKYFRNNVIHSLHLLEAMHDVGVRTIVFSSSCATYGLPDELPITEETRQRPVNPYGESKLMVERALHWYGEAYDLRWVALRYFNAAGADREGELAEVHDPETHLIPLAVLAALGRAPVLQIFGDDYPTVDGTPVRDYIHVDDLAHAHVLAIRYLEGGGPCGPFNVGTGHGYTVREVVDAVERVSGRKVPLRVGPRRPGDPPALVADASRAASLLGWHPECSDLDTIVRTAYAGVQRDTS